jgi:hypothetical protein
MSHIIGNILRHAWIAALLAGLVASDVAYRAENDALHAAAILLICAAIAMIGLRLHYTERVIAANREAIEGNLQTITSLRQGLATATAYADDGADGRFGACYQSVVDVDGRGFVPVVRNGAHPDPRHHASVIEELESRYADLANAPSNPGGRAS